MQFDIQARTLFIYFIFTFLFTPVFGVSVKTGDTRETVIKKLGKPSGNMVIGPQEILIYNGANIKLKNGRVFHIDKNFASKQAAGQAEAEFYRTQQEKGLVLHRGDWITEAELAAIKQSRQAAKQKLAAKRTANIQDIRENGSTIDMASVLAPGKVTVVQFHADWCGPCKKMGRRLVNIAKEDADIALRKIDIVNWGTPVTKQYQISSIPHVRVYGRNGKLIGIPTSKAGMILKYIQHAKQS